MKRIPKMGKSQTRTGVETRLREVYWRMWAARRGSSASRYHRWPSGAENRLFFQKECMRTAEETREHERRSLLKQSVCKHIINMLPVFLSFSNGFLCRQKWCSNIRESAETEKFETLMVPPIWPALQAGIILSVPLYNIYIYILCVYICKRTCLNL